MQNYKKEMFFVYRGSLDNPKSVGTNVLIKEGAKIVTLPQDIIENYTFLRKLPDVERKIRIDEDHVIEEEYKVIYNVLSEDAKDVNEIAKKSELPLNEVISKLTMLELDGKVKKLPGNKYKKF